ncbi:outer dynein arm-docking complex subunit 4-like isoform X2 [Mytilus californianus]|uniref:outer dynein arm-docking complex subunit 4-like isoform X2 n=1 Tax=Mytilus californianus TaxID=6549 RepID=UPI0022470ADB|nr:outer dynein arm-docking complex subunit 4-like isoform X2 [Mytilus californianus]
MSAKYHNRKTQVLNDVYRKEGVELMEENDFEGAVSKFNEALHLYPRDLKSLISRSKSYMQLRNIRKAIDDVETALHLNNLFKEALLQKADILYQTQDYDVAYIYYSRGHKVYPKNKGFIEGMKKTEHEIAKFKRGKGKKQKLTPAGDLTGLIHKVPAPKPFKFHPKQDRQVKHLPSATFSTRPLCQLIRIHKTPSISLMKSVSVPDLNDLSDDEDELQDKRPESRLVKSTIGEFYDDKKYLEKLAIGNKPSPPLWGTPLEAIANNALHFLFDRVTYWDRLGPLPPPPPPRKSKSKMSGSTMSLDSVLTVNTTNSKITSNSSYIFVDKKPVPTYRRRNSQVNIQLDPSKLNFNFKSIQSEREIRKMSRIPEDNELFADSPSGFGDATPESAGQSITDYIKKELEHINEGYKLGWIQETSSSCDNCIRLLEKYSEEEVPEIHELTAILHSYRGNCAVQRRQFDEALKHHQKDLSIGEDFDIRSCRHRALGNIGRVYMLKGKHQKALETLTMKAPLCKSAKDSSSLFHEIGNCFLVLSNFQYAKDAARKSLQCAEECGDKNLQLQACVLIGLAEVNMKKYKDAHKSFEEALTHAEALGDKKAEEAMKHALIDVNKKIAHKLKTKTIQNRTNEVNQQTMVTAV